MTDFAKDAHAPRRLRMGRTGRAVLAGVALSTCLAIPVLATPGSGFTPTSLSVAIFGQTHAKADRAGTWDLEFKSRGRTLVGVDQLVVAGNGQSGWRTHAGLTFVSVKSGSVRWTDGENCLTRTYNAGDGFIEPANHLHLVRNASATQGAEFIAVQMRPEGTPGRLDAAAPTNNCGL